MADMEIFYDDLIIINLLDLQCKYKTGRVRIFFFSYELPLHNYLELQIASSSYAVKILKKVVPIVTTNQTRYGIKFTRSRYKSSPVLLFWGFLSKNS